MDDPGEPFVIVIPPPNVTGSLHMGHALDNALQDVLIRRARMLGRNAVWLPGMDHAGIGTQVVVERELAKEGITRQDLGRERFLQAVWRFKEESGGMILRQLRRLGCSPDWEREAFTFDEQRSRAVRDVFCTWYERGLIYRGTRIINWDPQARTALSDIEVEHETVRGELVWIRYPEADGGEGVVVATTRPETMLADTAVAVHPEDERYRDLVGRTLRLPLLDRLIPIVADEHVDPTFGSGALKVTPAHDPNDHAIGQRHDLAAIDIFDETRRSTSTAGRTRGWTATPRASGSRPTSPPRPARQGRAARALRRPLPRRTRVAIEPRLSEQWFVAVRDARRRAIARCATAARRFVPDAQGQGFLRVARRTCTTGASRGSCGGATASRPGTTPTAGSTSTARTPTPRRSRRKGLRPGPRRPRHVVLLAAVAVHHAGLARGDPRAHRPGTRRRSSSPATTSTRSGSAGC